MIDPKEVLRMVEFVGSTFTRPTDDWEPVVFLFAGEEQVVISFAAMDDDIKENLPNVIANVLRKHRAESAAFVSSVWMTCIKKDDPLVNVKLTLCEEFSVRHQPNRTEAVMVETFDGTATENWQAAITRYDDKPPTLGKWKKMEGSATGRMVNVLQRAFALAQK